MSKQLKAFSLVMARIHDKALFINTGRRELSEPVKCVLTEVDPKEKYSYEVVPVESEGCMSYNYWVSREEITEVLQENL